MVENSANALLLADKGYAISPWLMTPYENPVSQAQKRYNKLHTKERVTIERCFGQVKRRFPFLQQKVRVQHERIPTLILCCFILHNVAKHVQDPDFDPIAETNDGYIEQNQSV